MSNADIVRAWKDEAYRRSLSEDQLASLPAHPAGTIELSNLDLDQAAGDPSIITIWSLCCSGATY
jgi:mersacidin/lichenicidin family type 2 lantibiotic